MPLDAEQRRSNRAVLLAVGVSFGLGAFAVFWSASQSSCYDDSDPLASLGGIVGIFSLPGMAVSASAALWRTFRKGHEDIWTPVCWTVVATYLPLAAVVAFLIAWGWGARTYCGAPYGG